MTPCQHLLSLSSLALLLLLLSLSSALDLTFSVRENVNKNTEVGNIRQQLTKQGTRFNGRPKFKMLEEERTTDLFKIDRTNGIIRTYSAIDREKLCEQKLECLINFLVRVSNSSMVTGLVKVIISIKDENDNAPQFQQKKTVVRVPEASNPDLPTAQAIQLPTAEDRDTSQFGIKQYVLENDDKSQQYLSLVVDSQAHNVLRPRLVMRKPLDREEQASFFLKLVAIDGGGKKGSIDVVVEVTDINDNPPKWKTNPIQTTVPECAERNARLVELQATDKDIGAYGRVQYRISKYAPVSVQQNFYIHDNELILSNGLDYEKQKIVKIPVEAFDGGGLTALATVHLRVQDCNDNKPFISIIKEEDGPSIMENDPKKKILATVVVRDLDTGVNGEVSCQLDKDVMDKFILHSIDINPKTYEIHNAPQAHFDREREAKVSVRISCQDGGEPRNSVTKEFYVTVNDINDNAPKFEQKPFRFSVSENMDYNTFIGTVRAVDDDVGQNARLTYFLDEKDSNSFRINKHGQLYSLRRFDREKEAQYSFKVYAKDHGTPSRTSEATVHVTILDVNDCQPRFNKTVYVFNVVESNGPRPRHNYLGMIQATDKDLGQNGTVQFNLQKNSAIKAKVVVSPTGHLSIDGVIDREQQADFNFDVVAHDGGVPSLSAAAMVKVNVLDINDNAPRFIHPSSPGMVVNISKPTTVGSTITTVAAHDPDFRENGTVTYSIQRPLRPDLFKLDDTTGTLILLRPIEKEAHRGPWRLTLKASDGGGKSSLTTLTIRLVNGRGARDSTHYNGRGGMAEDNSNMTILYALAAIVFAVFIILFFVLVMFYLRCCNCKGFTDGPRKEGDGEANHYDAVTTSENQYQERQGKETLPLDASLLPRDTGCQKVGDVYQNEDNGYTNLHTGQRVRSTSYGYIPVNVNDENFYGTRTMRRNNSRPGQPGGGNVGSYEAFNLVGGAAEDGQRADGTDTVKRSPPNVNDGAATGKLVSTHSYTRLESPSKTVNRADKTATDPSPFTSLKSPYITTSFV